MILQGKDLKITTASDGVLVAMSKTCTINVECDEIEVSGQTSGRWREVFPGRLAWSISMGYLVTAGGVAGDVLKVGTMVNIKVKDGETGTPLTGTALVKRCQMVGNVRSLSTGDCQLTGSGPLTEVVTQEQASR